MSIARKPKLKGGSAESVVDAVIQKGGSVAKRDAKPGKGITPVILRVPDPLLQQVDQTLEGRTIKKPRHTWLLEAIVEKLERGSK